jgi:hypothetical protein
MARRSRVGRRFRERLFRKALLGVGIDYDVILKQHARDNLAIQRFLRKQQRAAIAHARAISKRQSASLDALRNIPAETLFRGLDSVVRLDTAIAIENSSSSAGDVTDSWKIASPSPANNLIAGLHAAKSSNDATSSVSHSFDYHFLWMSDRDRLVVATSQIWPRVVWGLALESACVANCRVQAIASAQLQISQLDGSNTLHHTVTPHHFLFDELLEGTFQDGAVATNIAINAVPMASWNPIPLTKDRPALVTVSLHFVAGAFNGYAEVNYQSIGINVPFVDLYLFA